MMFNITPVVKNLIIINVVIYILFQGIGMAFAPGEALYLRIPFTEYFRPYQIITHMFIHLDISHLFMNMIGLVFFGPFVEAKIGLERFFKLYFIAGLGAMILQVLAFLIEFKDFPWGHAKWSTISMMGASGSVFGVLAAYAILFPNRIIMLIFPPITLKAKYAIILFIIIELISGLGMIYTNIAHFAHIGGAIFGYLVLKYWDKTSFNIRR